MRDDVTKINCIAQSYSFIELPILLIDIYFESENELYFKSLD